MNPIKKLAGQTALYGVSTILGRLLTYALVPLHTDVFTDTAQYGAITELYTYVTFLNVIYTFGMETAYFRFVSRHKADGKAIQDVYGSAFTSVFLVSLFLSGFIAFNADGIAGMIGYPGSGNIIVWLAVILFTDAIVAIPYARLRHENKAVKFTVTKLSAIVLTVFLNIFFLLLLPEIYHVSPVLEAMYYPDMGIGYVFLANLIGNAVIPVLLWRYLVDTRFKIEWAAFRPMVVYAFPILIMGLGGMVNENIEKLLLNDLLPVNFYPDKTPQEALGVYGACYKLSIFMMLAIQAFRYAGEPFFFSNAEDKSAPELFARVMHYFIILSILILVGVSVNLELIGTVFLRNQQYHDALYVVPFLLIAKLLYGVYINLSVWFKLTDKTMYGTAFSVVGAVVTIGGNILLIPYLGYLGCAIASIACYLVMVLACYYYGQKYYPIPYNFKPSFLYIIAAIMLIFFAFSLDISSFILRNAVNMGLVILFGVVVFLIEKRSLTYHKV